MPPDKPFKTYQEQVDKAREHNVIIEKNSNSEGYAIDALKQFGYYNLLNAYQDKFGQNNPELFNPPVQFSLLVLIKTYDEQISGIILPLILHLENIFENSISYHISQNFGVWNSYQTIDNPGYLAQQHYSNNTRYRKRILKKLREVATGYENGQSDGKKLRGKVSKSLIKYREEHNHVPPWILVNELNLGQSIRWYKICTPEIKNLILDDLLTIELPVQVRKTILSNSLELLSGYRNALAHGTSITKAQPILEPSSSFNLPIAVTNIFKNEIILSRSDYNSNLGKNDIYSILLSVAYLTRNYFGFTAALENLAKIFDEINHQGLTDEIIVAAFGLPKNIVYRLKKLSEFYKNQ